MSQMMKIRITGGPSLRTLKIEDIETGRLLPVTKLRFLYDINHHVAAKVTLLIHEIDVTLEQPFDVTENVMKVTPGVGQAIDGHPGVLVRDPRDTPTTPNVVH